MTIQTAPPGAAPPGSADTADQAAPLDALLADAALGTFRRFAPGRVSRQVRGRPGPQAAHHRPEAEQPRR
jgi:hypothetical protein